MLWAQQAAQTYGLKKLSVQIHQNNVSVQETNRWQHSAKTSKSSRGSLIWKIFYKNLAFLLTILDKTTVNT